MSIKDNYNHTIYASYIGYITQAIVNNFAPLLFLTFASEFSLGLGQITLITTVNFGVQLLVDFLSAKLMDKIGYRRGIIIAHICAALGLAGMAFLPDLSKTIFGNYYPGLMLAVVLYAIGGGIIEVLISPIVEACPTKAKEAAMSLLHSFYCWGQVAVVSVSTLFFVTAGIKNWRIMACIWAIIPLANMFYFMKVPIYSLTGDEEGMRIRDLVKEKTFWLLVILMICAGASELAMSQWASAFAESALGVSKTVGDLAGPCGFAVLMGTARAFYGKFSEHIPLKPFIMGAAVLCLCSYLLAGLSSNPVFALIGCALCGFSVGIFWPGTFSIAARSLPKGGTALFALLALAGDVGCSSGPTVVGFVADANGGTLKTALLVSVIFPIMILIFMPMLKNRTADNK